MRPVVSCILLFLLAPGTAGAGEKSETSGRLRLQLGHEYDTNAQRICTPPLEDDPSPLPPPDGVTRLIGEGTLEYTSQRHSLVLNFLGGVKLFSNQTNEDQMAVRLGGAYTYRPLKSWWLGGMVSAQDTTLRYHDRDYTLLRTDFYQRNRLASWLFLEAYAGAQYFYFKPDAYAIYALKYTHYGPLGGLRLLVFGEEVFSHIFYEIAARFVDDMSRDEKFTLTDQERFDLRHTGGLRVKHHVRYWGQRKLILGLAYQVSVNDTNSFGSSALWHRLRFNLSMQLPLDITLHLMGTLQFTDYLDGLPVEGSLYEVDADENENSLVVRISYSLYKGLSLVLHGAVYRNAFHSGTTEKIPFGRETIMLGLAYDYSF
jgi:hypothetical protein